MFPFEPLFDRKPRTTLHALLPHVDDTELSRGLDAFVEQRGHVLMEARKGLDNIHCDKVAVRQKINAQIVRPSAGVSVHPEDFVLMR